MRVTSLTMRHKQEREGAPLPSLHHSEQEGTRSEDHRATLAIVPPPLSPCRRSLLQAVTTL